MKEKYNDYLNQNYSFDKLTMAGIISLLIVIAGTFGFVYELIFCWYIRIFFGLRYIYYW